MTLEFSTYNQNPEVYEYLDIFLTKLAKKKPTSSEVMTKIQKILFGIAHDMASLHRKGEIYKELCPENIVMENSANILKVSICEIDLARYINESIRPILLQQQQEEEEEEVEEENKQMMMMMMGSKTPYFMPPEIMEDRHADKPSDVYSFSIIASMLIMKSTSIFSGNSGGILNVLKFTQKILEGGRPILNDDVPEIWKELLKKCWDQDMAKRPTFDEICSLIRQSGYLLKDCNKEEYINYCQMIDGGNLYNKNEGYVGCGEYASVFRSFLPKNNERVVAIKVMNKNTLTEATFAEYSQIQWPNKSPCLLKPTDINFSNGKYVITTDFAMNGRFDQYFRSMIENYDRPEVQTVIQKVILGTAVCLSHLHEHGLIHRDLGPWNILLDENYEPLVSDACLLRFIEKNYPNISDVGQELFNAPEIRENRQNYTTAADVYSFGQICYFAITKNWPLLPHDGGFTPPFPAFVSPAWKKLIVRCWSTDPNLRPTFPRILELLRREDYLLPNVDRSAIIEYQTLILKGATIAPQISLTVPLADEIPLKVVVVGAASVGKTMIITRFVSNSYRDDHMPTVGAELNVKRLSIENENNENSNFALNIWDTTGSEMFRQVLSQYYRGANIFIFVFDITHKSTFKAVHKLYTQAKKSFSTTSTLASPSNSNLSLNLNTNSNSNANSNANEKGRYNAVQCALFGNKADLADNRHVETEEAKKYAEAHDMLYFEISSKTGSMVTQAFEETIKAYMSNSVEDTSESDEDGKKNSLCTIC